MFSLQFQLTWSLRNSSAHFVNKLIVNPFLRLPFQLQCMYVCVIYITGSARNSTYITGFWAVGQKDEALDYTLIAAGC